MGPEVYISGVGMTKFGKSGQTLPELMVEAAVQSLHGRPDRHDRLYFDRRLMNAEEFTGEVRGGSDRRPSRGSPVFRLPAWKPPPPERDRPY